VSRRQEAREKHLSFRVWIVRAPPARWWHVPVFGAGRIVFESERALLRLNPDTLPALVGGVLAFGLLGSVLALFESRSYIAVIPPVAGGLLPMVFAGIFMPTAWSRSLQLSGSRAIRPSPSSRRLTFRLQDSAEITIWIWRKRRYKRALKEIRRIYGERFEEEAGTPGDQRVSKDSRPGAG
jgi:hypothetical protein